MCNLSASEVSQDQQFEDVTVHLSMSLLGIMEPHGGPVRTAGAGACKGAGAL